LFNYVYWLKQHELRFRPIPTDAPHFLLPIPASKCSQRPPVRASNPLYSATCEWVRPNMPRLVLSDTESSSSNHGFPEDENRSPRSTEEISVKPPPVWYPPFSISTFHDRYSSVLCIHTQGRRKTASFRIGTSPCQSSNSNELDR